MLKVVPIGAIALVFLGSAAAEPLTLAKKAAVFEHDLRARFLLDGQALCKLKLPSDSVPFVSYNMPDNAYMTGIVLGAWSMKYAVTKDPADKAVVGELLDALNLLCTVSGKKGLLARAAWPTGKEFNDDGVWRPSPDGRHQWRGDVSSDQMTGVLYGYAVAHELAADDAEKAVIARNVADLVDHLLENDLRIVGYDGEPTMWGRYYPEYVKGRENMNALLFLQHLKVAAQVTGEARFAEAYAHWAVEEEYAKTAVKARRTGNPARMNHSDNVLLMLAYYPLLRIEPAGGLRDLYLQSLRRTWEGDRGYPGVEPLANPFYAFLARTFLGESVEVAPGVKTLEWFPLDAKWNQDTLAKYEKEFGFKYNPTPASPLPEEGEAIPVDRRAKTWSAWVANAYTDAGNRSADAEMEYNGHDSLMAYWLGRFHGYVDADS